MDEESHLREELIEIFMSVLKRRTNSSGWWGRQAEEKESIENSLRTCDSWRNAGARARLLSAVRWELSRLGKVLEEDRVGGIPGERVAWRVPG